MLKILILFIIIPINIIISKAINESMVALFVVAIFVPICNTAIVLSTITMNRIVFDFFDPSLNLTLYIIIDISNNIKIAIKVK